MKDLIKIVVTIVHLLSFCGAVILVVLGYLYDAVGPAKYEQLASLVGISDGLKTFRILGIVVLSLLIVTFLVKRKFF